MRKNREEQKETEVLLSRRETKKGGGKKRKKIKTDKKRRGEGEDRILAYLFHPLLFVFKRISLHSSAFLVPLCPSLFSSTSFLHTYRERKKRNTEKREGKKERKLEGGEEYVGASMSRRERDSGGQRGVEILGSCQMAHCALEARPSSF